MGNFSGELNDNMQALITSISTEDQSLLQKSYEGLLSNSLRQQVEFRIRLKDGKEKWISLTAYCILEEGKRYMLTGFAEDITHIKENEIPG